VKQGKQNNKQKGHKKIFTQKKNSKHYREKRGKTAEKIYKVN
jgi:hypothetical protein